MRRLICLVLLALSTLAAHAQQDYVGRYALYAGYSHLVTPDMRLYQKGFNLDAGVNVRRWVSLGVDYSRFDGLSAVRLDDLNAAQQAKLIPYLKNMPGYVLDVPFDARTYTITGGPQINIRRKKNVTYFVRPACGMVHEVVTGKPRAGDTFGYLATANMVGPSLAQADFIRFYGVGGGANFKLSRHMGVRVSADYVHSFLFKDVLARPRNTLRFSIGPSVNFGHNVK